MVAVASVTPALLLGVLLATAATARARHESEWCAEQRRKCVQNCPTGGRIKFDCVDKDGARSVSCACVSGEGHSRSRGSSHSSTSQGTSTSSSSHATVTSSSSSQDHAPSTPSSPSDAEGTPSPAKKARTAFTGGLPFT